MGRGKKYQPEQVVNLLRQIEVAVSNGKTTAVEGVGTGECEAEATDRKSEPGQACFRGLRAGKLLSPERRRCAVEHACTRHGISERRACDLAQQRCGTQRYRPTRREDEDALTQAIIQLASQYGRYGYRRITALLQAAGWQVGKDRVERIWRSEGLKVPQKQKPRGRLWLNDGSCGTTHLTFEKLQPSSAFLSLALSEKLTFKEIVISPLF
jgi:hypothetical protein